MASVTVRHLREKRSDKGTLFGQIEDQIGKAPTEFDGLQWVGFEDFEDPKTVFAVNPKDLTASYGKGYTLTRLTIQITDDPVTEGEVEKVLGDDFFSKSAQIHKSALARGLDDPYFKSLPAKMSRNQFVRKQK